MISKIVGLLILLLSFAVIYLFESQSSATGFVRILHWPAILLTGVGPLGLLLISSDKKSLFDAIKLIVHSPVKLRENIEHERILMKELSEKYYTKGAQSFAVSESAQMSPAFKLVVEKLSLKIPVADIKTLLLEQQDSTDAQISRSISVMGLLVKLTPSVGMLGTILGMVQLLGSLQDPSEIGSHMSLALLTTFYGLFFSLVVWTPAQYRLQSMLGAQHQGFDQLEHWLSLLENRKPSEYLVREDVLDARFKSRK